MLVHVTVEPTLTLVVMADDAFPLEGGVPRADKGSGLEAFKTYCFWTLAKMWINTEKTKGKKSMNKVHDLIALTVEEAQR